MSATREKLHDALLQYTEETLLCIETVQQFSENISEWVDDRTTTVLKMENLKTSFSKIDLSISDIIQSKKKKEALKDCLKNKIKQLTQESVEEQRAKLEKELVAVLMETLCGLEKLNHFLEAVEKLAVTSLHVFMVGNPVLKLPEEVSLRHVQEVIIAARQILPQLLEFKRDASDFFSPKCPKLENLDLMAHQLDRYIRTTQWICENLQISHLSMRESTNIQVNLDEDLTDDEIQRMLFHIKQLIDLRMDPNFRLVFLFQEVSSYEFIKEFTKLQPKMLQYLKDLEKIAVKLDSVAEGATISRVVCSSVGVIGGVLSIIGLALNPVAAGASAVLIMAGAGCGVLSGVASLATAVTESVINYRQQNKAREISLNLSKDMQSLYRDLKEVTTQTISVEENLVEMVLREGKHVTNVYSVGKKIVTIVDAASDLKVLRTEGLVTSTTEVMAQEGSALRNVPRVAEDIPDIGQAALKGPLALSKWKMGFLIGVNSIALAFDFYSVITDSNSLYEGIETKMSQFIRARAALWRSEIEGWEKIHDSLSIGLMTSESNIAALSSQFYF